MILQALNDYYRRAPDLAPAGWIRRGMDYLIVLDKEGRCINLERIQDEVKGKAVPHQMLVPHIGKQALKHNNSGTDANLLWDKSGFVLGGDGKGKAKLESFIATIEHWFPSSTDDGILAVLKFSSAMLEQTNARTELLKRFGVKELFDEKERDIAFKLHGDLEPIHARRQVREDYERQHTQSADENEIMGNCLVTGAEGVPIALNETVLKGIYGGQSAGVNIVSFNARAFESYGKRERKGENAPISKAASFAYSTALNGLLQSPTQKLQVADATTVFWASEQHAMEGWFGEILGDDPERGTEALKAMLNAAKSGHFTIGEPKARFHVLGLAAPSNSRVAVRFYLETETMELANQLISHFEDLRVTESTVHYSIKRLLRCIAVRGEDKNIPDGLSAEFMRAIVEGQSYPTVLLSAVVQRCRAEQSKRDKQRGWQNVTAERAALVKACLNRTIRRNNQNSTEPETLFTPMLDPTNPNRAYRLGRLFATLEKVQEEANQLEKLNATIRDKYYGAASSTPRTVFSTLIRLNQHHLSKLRKDKETKGLSVVREKLIQEIANGLNDFPAHLTLPDQGRFALGYYHQRQDFFKGKPNTPDEPSNN